MARRILSSRKEPPLLITVHLPRSAAAKLAELEATPGSEILVADLKNWLAMAGGSGARLAAAPPVCLTVAGGADLLLRIDALRRSIEKLTGSINTMLGLATDVHALLDLDDHPAFDALVAHRLFLERQEEALICAAIASGLVVARRPNADPRAVLEIMEFDELPTAGAA
jgi:hypothetical protein